MLARRHRACHGPGRLPGHRLPKVGRSLAVMLAFVFIVLLFVPPSALAWDDDYPAPWRAPTPKDSMVDTWGYYNRECTSFVAWRLHSRNGFEMPWAIGNADAWGGWAASHGYAVNSTPAVGSVAWFASGHVTWVERVNANNTVTIEEYNYDYNGDYNERTIADSTVSGFIHFKDIISSPPTIPVVQVGDAGFDAVVASWSSSDPVSGISEYQYCLGTAPGASNLMAWTSVGTSTGQAISGLDADSESEFLSVKARNGAGIWSDVSSSPQFRPISPPFGSLTDSPVLTSDQPDPSARYKALIAPKNYDIVPADTTTAPRRFTTATSGLVAVRYLYTIAGSGSVHCMVDGMELCNRNAGNDGVGVHTRTDYIFLRAGKHSLSFWVQGVAASVNGVSVGLDPRYKALLAPKNYNLVPADTDTTLRRFTTKTSGLVAVRYLYTIGGSGSVHPLIDGLELASRSAGNDGVGVHTRTDYVFLRAGKHTLSFWVQGVAAYLNGVSLGLDPRYKALIAPKNYDIVPADTTTAPRRFTTATSGLVAVRYLYTIAGSGSVHCMVDGMELCNRNAGNDGVGVHTRTDYIFLRAGKHSLSFWVQGVAASVNGVSVGLDPRYKALLAPKNYNLVPADTDTTLRRFTTKTSGLVAVRYLYTIGGSGSVHPLIDGLELASRSAGNDGVGVHTRTDYVFLRAGKHTLSFWVQGVAAYLNGVSLGLDPRYKALIAPKNYDIVPADTTTAPRRFTTATSGLVAVRYLYTIAGSGSVHCMVDGMELCNRNAGNDGVGVHTRTDYIFLRAGKHSLSFWVQGVAASVNGVSVGLDPRYKALLAPKNYNLVPADTDTTLRRFTTKTSGLVAVRYLYTIGGSGSVHPLIDGLELASRSAGNDGVGVHTRTDYVFLRAGKHTLSFWVQGVAAYLNGVSLGLDPQ